MVLLWEVDAVGRPVTADWPGASYHPAYVEVKERTVASVKMRTLVLVVFLVW